MTLSTPAAKDFVVTDAYAIDMLQVRYVAFNAGDAGATVYFDDDAGTSIDVDDKTARAIRARLKMGPRLPAAAAAATAMATPAASSNPARAAG